MREKDIIGSRYTKISERKVNEIASVVQQMYSSNGIPVEVTNKEIPKKLPEVSVTVNSTGITFRLGIKCKKTTITKVVPKKGV